MTASAVSGGQSPGHGQNGRGARLATGARIAAAAAAGLVVAVAAAPGVMAAAGTAKAPVIVRSDKTFGRALFNPGRKALYAYEDDPPNQVLYNNFNRWFAARA